MGRRLIHSLKVGAPLRTDVELSCARYRCTRSHARQEQDLDAFAGSTNAHPRR